ncbi:TPA: twin-arginine translocation signal domain-containing protein, partial [Escherichia coli]|nr:twin-arginine translocation signal domain-containing protein [Escherichia coli]
MSFHFSRRSFLQYAPIATAAVAVPVVSAAIEPEKKEQDIRDFLAKASATDRARY